MKFITLNQIFSKPNQITYIRILMIPIFAIFLHIDKPYANYIAAFIFSLLSLSDAFDGYIARKNREVTDLGKILDPIADKLLISTALLVLIGRGVPAWMAIVIIARELIVTFFRILLINKKVVPADKLGKIKTITQTVAILAAMLQLPFTWHLMLAAVILTAISGISYIIRMIKMADEKVLNLPNIITLSRFALLPLFAVMVINSKFNYALVIFSIIALSDKIDGISARVMKQVTDFGRVFDSFTDWSVFLLSFALFGILGYLEILWIILLLIPAIIISIAKFSFIKRQKEVPVTPIARVSVAMSYATVISILINFDYKNYVLLLTFITVYLSMFRYIMLSKSLVNKITAFY